MPAQAKRLMALDKNKDGRLAKDEVIDALARFQGRGAQPAASGAAGEAAKVVVIAMTSTTCPVSKRYAPSFARLENELAAQGVALLLVNPFESEKAEEIAAFNKEQGFTAPYVHDAEKTFAAALRARSTTEVFLLDATRTLLYRGALDDQYGLSYNLDAPRVNYLRDAVSALLAGGRPDIAATEPPGCELDLPAEKSVATSR